MLSPVVAGTLGGVLAKWVTFAPLFLIIFVGAPYIEALRNNKALAAVLTTITAAVVGVILKLAVWFGLHTLFARVAAKHIYVLTLQVPYWSSLDHWSLLLSAIAAVLLFRFKVGMMTTFGVCCIAGIAVYLLGWLTAPWITAPDAPGVMTGLTPSGKPTQAGVDAEPQTCGGKRQ